MRQRPDIRALRKKNRDEYEYKQRSIKNEIFGEVFANKIDEQIFGKLIRLSIPFYVIFGMGGNLRKNFLSSIKGNDNFVKIWDKLKIKSINSFTDDFTKSEIWEVELM